MGWIAARKHNSALGLGYEEGQWFPCGRLRATALGK